VPSACRRQFFQAERRVAIRHIGVAHGRCSRFASTAILASPRHVWQNRECSGAYGGGIAHLGAMLTSLCLTRVFEEKTCASPREGSKQTCQGHVRQFARRSFWDSAAFRSVASLACQCLTVMTAISSNKPLSRGLSRHRTWPFRHQTIKKGAKKSSAIWPVWSSKRRKTTRSRTYLFEIEPPLDHTTARCARTRAIHQFTPASRTRNQM